MSTIDVLSYFLVPKMDILSEKEKKKLFEEYGINETQLPRMSVDDAAAKALKANIGDVVAIHREEVTGKTTSYRIVN